MSVYFQKLNFSIDLSDLNFTSFKGDFYYGYNCNGSELNYYYIRDDLKSLIRQLFSEIANVAPSQFKFVEITGTRSPQHPHRDYGLLCSINYYFKAGAATTKWYKAREHVVKRVDHAAQTCSYAYDEIEFAEQFTAIDGECYLFNSGEIHSVIPGVGDRQFIQIQYDKPYHEITALLGRSTGIEPVIAESQPAVLPLN